MSSVDQKSWNTYVPTVSKLSLLLCLLSLMFQYFGQLVFLPQRKKSQYSGCFCRLEISLCYRGTKTTGWCGRGVIRISCIYVVIVWKAARKERAEQEKEGAVNALNIKEYRTK
jgi:hypothetical protein